MAVSPSVPSLVSPLPAIKKAEPLSVKSTPADMEIALDLAFKQKQEALTKIEPVLATVLATANSADAQLKETMRVQTEQANVSIDEINTAQARKIELANIPSPINTFLGFFDPSFSVDTLDAKITKASFNLQTAATRTKQAVTNRDLTVQTAQRVAVAAEQFYTFNRQNLLDTSEFIRLGFDMKEGVRKDQVDMVTGASRKQLAGWVANPDTMPVKLIGTQGLAETELYRRNMQDAGLTQTNISNRMQQELLNDRVAAEVLSSFKSIPDLETAVEGGKLPKEVTPDRVRKYINNRKEVEMNLEASADALALGKNLMAAKFKAEAVAKIPLNELEEGLRLLTKHGASSIDVKRVNFTKPELEGAVARLQAIKREQSKLLSETIAAVGATAVNQETAVEQMVSIGGLLNPESPEDGIPRELRSLFKKNAAITAVLEAHGSPEDAVKIAEIWEAHVTAANSVIDKTIEHGVLTDWFLFCDDTMRIAPPLVISENEIREACRIILLSIDEVLIKSEPSHL